MNIAIYAASVMAAQGATLTDEHRAVLVGKADRFRQITGTTEPTPMNVPVIDAGTGATLGHITFTL